MSYRRALIVCSVLAWLLGVVWLVTGQAQVQALPPNDYRRGPPLPYDNLPDMPPIGGGGLQQAQQQIQPVSQPETPTLRPYQPAPYTGFSYDVPPPQMPPPVNDQQLVNSNVGAEPPVSYEDCWTWQILPAGLMYKSYLAGGREPRFASKWIHEREQEWLWDASLGGRVGLLRFGTGDSFWPEGWQLDFEGAAFPRLSLELDRELVATDYRVGVPLTSRQGPWEAKIAYYHLSSHLGDEYKLRYPSINRINYVRDCIVLGLALRPGPAVRLYAEAGWAFNIDGGSKPWEFQFGIDASPEEPTGFLGAPFFAVNGRIREEVDYGGNVTVQTGWAWRGQGGQLMRLGMQYFNGMSDYYQFFTDHEEQIGIGLWYDY